MKGRDLEVGAFYRDPANREAGVFRAADDGYGEALNRGQHTFAIDADKSYEAIRRTPTQQARVDHLVRLMDDRDCWPNVDYGREDLIDVIDGGNCPRWAAITYDETYTFITLFATVAEATRHLEMGLGDITGGSVDGVVNLDNGSYFRAKATVKVSLVFTEGRRR